MAHGYPLQITPYRWFGMPFPRLDAVLEWENNKAFFFSGGSYVRMNRWPFRLDHNPRSIAQDWSSVIFDSTMIDDRPGNRHGTKFFIFERLFNDLPRLTPEPDDLRRLGEGGGLMQATADNENPLIPNGYTYLGQFIDHDITFDPTSNLYRFNDLCDTRNFRTPQLELDNIYGSGPDDQPYLYHQVPPSSYVTDFLLGEDGNDLPRNSQNIALIGDPRNDENRIVSQLQLAFLKFHNKVVDILAGDGVTGDHLFAEAQELVRRHYQWIIVHDFLKRIVDPAIVNDILDNGRRFYRPEPDMPFMPVEFSVAAFRFGHTMVRREIRFNDAFPAATLEQLFNHTQQMDGQTIDWPRFFDIDPADPAQRSHRIDTRLAPPLLNLPRRIVPFDETSLAQRNLLRGRVFRLPPGQDVARKMNITPLSLDEIRSGYSGQPVDQILGAPGFDEATPLWFYILKEAEVRENGERLGDVGGRLVAEVILGLLQTDRFSYVRRDPAWQPTLWSAVLNRHQPDNSMAEMLRFTFGL